MTRILSFCFVLALPSFALANEDLDEAARLYSEADLEGALGALDRAETSGVTREELVQLYTQRVLVQMALGNDDAVSADLRRLASLEPNAELPPEVPPTVSERFAAMAGPALTIGTAVEPGEAEVRVRASVENDRESLTRSTVVGARVAGGDWLEDEAEIVLEMSEPGEIETYAQALGPGGTVIASDGTPDDPVTRAIAPTGGAPTEGGLGTGAIVGVAVAAIVVVAGVAVAVALASGGGDGPDAFQPGAPIVEF